MLSSLSQFFHNRLFFSNQAKLRSTTQCWGITLNVCNSLLGDLYADVFAQNVSNILGERLAHIATVTQQRLHLARYRFAALQCLQP